jgi:magnesium-transporting ATPase (P-type)
MKDSAENNEYLVHTYSYLALRKAVGWIGILLPVVLSLGAIVLFGEETILKNISLYYHSGMRDVLVGSISAIALFMFFYKGYDKWDNRTGNLAGLFAIGIALFPTVKEGPYDLSAYIHFICAAAFFTLLSVMSIFLFTRSKPYPTKRKLIRNNIYIICGLVMIASMLAILIFLIFFDAENQKSSFMFWAESVALMAFGASWLTKGGTLYPDKKKSNKPVKKEAKTRVIELKT